MTLSPSLLNNWTQENNQLASSFTSQQQDAPNQDHNSFRQKRWSSDFYKLLRKIQGIPPHVDYAQSELSVVYNTCVCFTAQAQVEEAESLLTQTAQRVLEILGGDPGTCDPSLLWRATLKSVASTTLHGYVLSISCLQWGVWSAKSCLNAVKDFQEEMLSLETQSGPFWDERRTETKRKIPTVPRSISDPRRLVESLKACTAIVQGAERSTEGWSTLSASQAASSLPAPRTLIAYTHLLSGSCLAHMNRPHMASQCYRKASETDPQCVCALYQSVSIYRRSGNSEAEIQALRISHSTLLLPSATEPAVAASHPLSPSLFLCSQSSSSSLSVPSALSVLHSLASKCVIHGRVSEGVEYYSDSLAAILSEDQRAAHAPVSTLPKLPTLYLEAGTALLVAQRPGDCMALCDEVIGTTSDSLPEKVSLEDPEDASGTGSREVREEAETGSVRSLWTAAAYLLQGHSHSQSKDWKQAITHYTRCINSLMKVHQKKRGFSPQIPSTDKDPEQGIDFCILQRLKGLSFAGRGISFAQIDRSREALRDLQFSSQAFPVCVSAGQWCGEVSWRSDRRPEAAVHWGQTQSHPIPSLTEALPLYAQELRSGPLLDSYESHQRLEELGPT